MTRITEIVTYLATVRQTWTCRRYTVVMAGVFCFIYVGMYGILKTAETMHVVFIDQSTCKTSSCEDNIIRYNEINFINKTTKKVLLWTTFFISEWSAEPGKHLASSQYKCTITSDRNEVESADAILFHYLDLWAWETMPRYRTPDKVWILFNAEAPPHLHYTGLPWIRVFNWTMSYRRDSTVHGPYGAFVPLTPEETIQAAKLYSNVNFAQSKSKMVVAVISDCPDDAKRYRHMRELTKHVDVDFFGKCGNLSCPRTPGAICNSRSYRFRIAFENANCKDYVTEKFWNALLGNVIPIVNWKKDQVIDTPPHSYINIHDFESAKHLGDYLKLLAKNDTLYNEYFHWRLKYKIFGGDTMWYPFKHLCDALHTPRPAQTIVDPNAWIRTDSCHKWSVTGALMNRWDRFKFDWGW